jgi:hypothetical protein
VSVEYGCSTVEMKTGKQTERDGETCFRDAFGDVAGFVGFDYQTRTRVNLLKPTYAGPKSKPENAATDIAPDRGKPWERYAACAEGQTLMSRCKHAGIALDEAKAAADGWTPAGPLPALPTVAKGAVLEPGDQVCRSVYDWITTAASKV